MFLRQINLEKQDFNLIDRPFIHDISTPISSLSCILELIDGSENDKSEIYKQASFSLKEIRSLISRTSGLLDGKYQTQNFNLKTEMLKCLNIFKYYAKREQISIKTVIPNKLYLYGDKSIFRRIIINIIKNAFEEIQTNSHENRYIFIDVKTQGSEILISICDSGDGFKETNLKTVFDYGFSTKKSSGVGLSFVKESIEQYFHGNIEVLNQKTGGGKILLRIPI